jgi:hypothetical protein
MRGQVGNWSDRLAVGFSEEMLEWVAQGQTPALVLSVSPNLWVTVRREVYGGRPSRSANYHRDFPKVLSVKHPVVCGSGLSSLPRFGLHEIDFKPSSGALVAKLPPVHELPEFALGRSCIYSSELSRRDAALRQHSALRSAA